MKYYWLKLQADFFDREEVKIIEMQQNGYKYINFYLKLILKSINTGGRLMFRDIIPYTPEMLSNITNTDIDTVKVATQMFIGLGLMQQLDDGALFMVETQNMIGSETKWAEKKRVQREKKKEEKKLLDSGDNVPKVSQKVRQEKEKDLDKEKEIDLDKDIDNKLSSSFSEVFKIIEKSGFRVTSLLVEQVNNDIEQFGAEWVKEAVVIASNRGKTTYSYMKGILENWGRDGKKGDKKNGNDRSSSNTDIAEEGIGL
ncbi:MAG: phage replisome organizer N-terminal domain-containing protein [Sarcina sp.]